MALPAADNGGSAPPLPVTATVVIACYDAAATIAATLASVLAQTVTDLQILVVDDGSRDRSAGIVRGLAAQDTRIELIEQANAGPSAARNRGVDRARGRFIAFLDADDIWLPSHLALHVAALDADPGIGVSFSPCRHIDARGVATGQVSRVWTADIQVRDVLAGNPASTCSTMVVRREVFADAGLMRVDMAYAEDQEWLFRVVASRWRVRGIADYTVLYRVSPTSLSSDTRRMLAGWVAFLDHARKTSPEAVATYLPYATWHMRLYHARRAVQSGASARVACGHLIEGIVAAPGMAARSPLRTLALAGACVAPRLARGAMGLARGRRHD